MPSSTAAAPATSSPAPRYVATTRVLHWIVAGAIVLQYLLGERAEEAAANNELLTQLATLAQHKSIGITVLALVSLRIIWRWRKPAPPLPSSYVESHPSLARIAKWMHIALYALLLFLPLSGWLMSSASAYSVSWFGWVQLPDMIAPNETAKDWLQSAHHLGAKVLLVLAVLHIAAALKHLLIDKDKLMSRMTDPVALALFAGTIVVGGWLTWPGAMPAAAADTTQTSTSVAPITEPTTKPAPEQAAASNKSATSDALPTGWKIDYSRSQITFTAEQAGAQFSGRWQEFAADIHFDPTNLAESHAKVTIAATSVATEDAERDSTLAGADWFDSARFDTVVFEASEFSATADGFTTPGTLKIRGASYPVSFAFSVDQTGPEIELTGSARLDRLALNLGTVEWTDTEWVGQFVTVDVVVRGSR